MSSLVEKVTTSTDAFDLKEIDPLGMDGDFKDRAAHKLFSKGQSKRIWAELYKVLDSSDVVMQILDARDPMGTRSRHIENHLKKNAK